MRTPLVYLSPLSFIIFQVALSRLCPVSMAGRIIVKVVPFPGALSTSKGPEGTGLGLSVVHSIISRSEGTIEVESAP
ncbi:MAG: hypothetical protein DSY91_03245, partial [Deltaproteobacteria bacterium]